MVEQSQRATVDALRNERDISVTEMQFPESDALLLATDAVILIVAADALKLALRLIARIRSESPCCGVVLVGVEIAEPEMLSLLRAGVYDFVSAPFHACELIARVRRVLGLLRLESDEHAAHISTHIIGRSHRLRWLATVIARNTLPVSPSVFPVPFVASATVRLRPQSARRGRSSPSLRQPLRHVAPTGSTVRP